MSKFCGLCGKPIESGTVCAQCGGSQSPVKPVQPARGGATPPKKSKKKLIQIALTRMTERCVTNIMTKRDCFNQIKIQIQGFTYRPRNS